MATGDGAAGQRSAGPAGTPCTANQGGGSSRTSRSTRAGSGSGGSSSKASLPGTSTISSAAQHGGSCARDQQGECRGQPPAQLRLAERQTQQVGQHLQALGQQEYRCN